MQKKKNVLFHVSIVYFIIAIIFFIANTEINANLSGTDSLYKGYVYTETSKYPDAKLPFRIYAPDDYKEKSYPLVVHLNGVGENGEDNEKQITYPNMITKSLLKPKNREKYSCIILAPQCPSNDFWVKDFYDSPTQTMNMTISLISLICSQYNVDKSRLYVTGYSSGGSGTWDMLYKYPEMFAAAIPLCGYAEPFFSSYIKDVPIWVFHSKGDQNIAVEQTRDMVTALQESGSTVIKYTEVDSNDHGDAWVSAYNNGDLLSWLFSQKNLNPQTPSKLNGYIQEYKPDISQTKTSNPKKETTSALATESPMVSNSVINTESPVASNLITSSKNSSSPQTTSNLINNTSEQTTNNIEESSKFNIAQSKNDEQLANAGINIFIIIISVIIITSVILQNKKILNEWITKYFKKH